MNDELLAVIIGGLVAILGSLLTAFVTYKLQRKRASDKELFYVWRMAFDRPAFKGPYTWHSDQLAFKRAIDLTLKAVNTGVLLDRHDVEMGRGRGKAYIGNSKRRSTMDDVERRLNHIRGLIPEPGQPPQEGVAATMDDARDEIIRTLNEVWKELGIPLLPIPSKVGDMDDVLKK